MDTIGIIKPTHVWITSATARWTNEKAAEALARRKAGIDTKQIIKVARVLNSEFFMIDEEEFIRKTNNTKYVYMYGTIIQAPKDVCVNGDISAITTDMWSAISYHVYNGDKREVPPSKKEIINEFESVNNSISPAFITRCESISPVDTSYDYCMVLAAMILGEPQ